MAAFWTSAVGTLAIAWTLREIFRDLFQPTGSGALSSFVGRTTLALGRRVRLLLPIAGPLTVVAVIVCWALLIAVGFALIYWPRFPQDFRFSQAEPGDPLGRFWTVLYFSLASLTTLASGELTPNAIPIRMLTALESLIGIALITASVTWIVLIYPALGRMRELARRTSVLLRAQDETGISMLSGPGELLLGDLAQSVIRMRIDLIHFPLIYYFHAESEGASLAKSLEQLGRFARIADENDRTDSVRLAATMLKIALADIAEVLVIKFVHQADAKNPPGAFRAMAEDHRPANGNSENKENL